MSTLYDNTGLLNGSQPLTANLKGWWKFWDNNSNSLADSSGNSRTLSNPSAVSAGFWAAAAKGNYNANNDRHYLSGNSTALELGSLNQTKSFIVAIRLKLSAAPASYLQFIGKRANGDAGIMVDVGAAGTARARIFNPASASYDIASSVIISDNAPHHLVLVHDPDIDDKRYLYLDGVDVSVVTATQTLSNALLQFNSSNTAEFAIGVGAGTFAAPLNGIGADATATMDIWDVQAYIPTGSLPANYKDLIAWLVKHPYQAIPASLW